MRQDLKLIIYVLKSYKNVPKQTLDNLCRSLSYHMIIGQSDLHILTSALQEPGYLDRSPAFLTSEDFISSSEIIRTKWPIYVLIGRFVLTI